MARNNRPRTPDGRYLVSRGILKRCTNPALEDSVRRRALKKMMQARISGDKTAVIAAKTELGETGPVWWNDGAADVSGQPPSATDYAQWWFSLSSEEREAGEAQQRLK